MRPANERRRYIVKSSSISRAHRHYDPRVWMFWYQMDFSITNSIPQNKEK